MTDQNTIPAGFDPNRHYLDATWPAVRSLLVDPMDDDAPDDARRAAVDKLVTTAVLARKTNSQTRQQDELVEVAHRAHREAFPESKTGPTKGIPPHLRTRALTALSSTAGSASRLSQPQAEALDSCLSRPLHQEFLRGLDDLAQAFEAGLEAEPRTIPVDVLEQLDEVLDVRAIGAATAALPVKDVSVDTGRVIRGPRQLDDGNIVVPATGPIAGRI